MALPPGGSTCADPPPEIIPTSAWPPMIAMLWIFDGTSGRTVGLFFSRTMLFSSTRCATSNPFSTSTTLF